MCGGPWRVGRLRGGERVAVAGRAGGGGGRVIRGWRRARCVIDGSEGGRVRRGHSGREGG